MQCIHNYIPLTFFRAKNNDRRSELMQLVDVHGNLFFGKLFIMDETTSELQYEGIVYEYIMSFFRKNANDTYKKNFVRMTCHTNNISFNDMLLFLNKSSKTITENQFYINLAMSHPARNEKISPSFGRTYLFCIPE